LDPAHVDISLHLEVSVVPPCGTPRILDDPVVDVVFSAVSDCQDSMVDVHGAVLAGGVRVDTRLIVTEAADDLEGDGHGAHHEEVVAHVVLAQGDVVGATDDTHRPHLGLQPAGEGLCLVGVVGLRGDTTRIHDVLEGVRGEPTVATEVIEVTRTVHELLLTQISELTVLLHEVGLKGTYCRERPAAATLTLVLHWGHHTEVSPVPMSRDVFQREFKGLCVLS
jgi:hypothetical protein